MAIDKESSGLPEVDLARPTTKVNLGIIVAAGLFYILMFALVYYLAREHPGNDRPSPPTVQESGQGAAPATPSAPRP
jgi:hypothetical protein